MDLVLSSDMENWLKEALERPLPAHFKGYVARCLSSMEHLKEELLESIGILKIKPLFLDISRYSFAYKVILKAFEVFSLPYYPGTIGYAWANPAVDTRKSKEITEAILNPYLNPYLNYFDSRGDEFKDIDLLGISLIYSSQLLPALTLARIAKLYNKNTIVLLGGPCASRLREPLNHRFGHIIDQIIPGDSEAFFEYLSNSGVNLEDEGSVLTALQQYVALPAKKWFKAPDSSLDYSWADLREYLLPEPVFCLDITRGCYYGKCVFCAYGHLEASYRRMEAPDVIRVIKGLKEKFMVKRFFFSVDVVDPHFLEQLSQRLIEAKVTITYSLEARMEKKFADQSFAQQLFESGCRTISFGMESASQATLDRMAKGTDIGSFSSILRALNRAQIHVQLHLIHGFPGESPWELAKTVKFLREHAKDIVTVGASRFTMLKGSKMEKNPNHYGISPLVTSADMALDYGLEPYLANGYPEFNTFEKELFTLFPTVARLTGSTTDSLIYASHYTPSKMRELLRLFVEF